jgi:hypothetical protein
MIENNQTLKGVIARTPKGEQIVYDFGNNNDLSLENLVFSIEET